jgi:hypothetical protein
MKQEVINPVSLTTEEKKVIFNSLRYWQMYKTTYDSREYRMCTNLLSLLYDEVYTQKKEQLT